MNFRETFVNAANELKTISQHPLANFVADKSIENYDMTVKALNESFRPGAGSPFKAVLNDTIVPSISAFAKAALELLNDTDDEKLKGEIIANLKKQAALSQFGEGAAFDENGEAVMDMETFHMSDINALFANHPEIAEMGLRIDAWDK